MKYFARYETDFATHLIAAGFQHCATACEERFGNPPCPMLRAGAPDSGVGGGERQAAFVARPPRESHAVETCGRGGPDRNRRPIPASNGIRRDLCGPAWGQLGRTCREIPHEARRPGRTEWHASHYHDSCRSNAQGSRFHHHHHRPGPGPIGRRQDPPSQARGDVLQHWEKVRHPK